MQCLSETQETCLSISICRGIGFRSQHGVYLWNPTACRMIDLFIQFEQVQVCVHLQKKHEQSQPSLLL